VSNADAHDPDAGLIERPVSSRLIYDGKIVHLYVDEVRLPDGQAQNREIVRHTGAVAVVPVDGDGNIVMVRQYRYAAGRVLLEIPAGTLESDEDPEACAVRELQEEAGFRPGMLTRLGGMFVAPSYTTEFIHLYLATDLEPSKLEGDDDEFLEVLHLSPDAVLQHILSGAIADGKTIAGFFLAQERLRAL
jgi:8-oxo-dGTP pyrophosphatase MutT (NUDIX family)